MRHDLVCISSVFFMFLALGAQAQTPVQIQLQAQIQPLALAKSPTQASVTMVHQDLDAYYQRLQMIASAQSEILVEYYSFDQDDTAMTFLGALVNAARRGVKVKLIADDLTRSISNSIFAALLEAAKTSEGLQNFQIHLYNPFKLNFFTINNRDHAKMLVIDRNLALVGGRNIGGKYFGTSDRTFLDLDVMVQGPVVADLVSNFEAVFGSHHTSGPLSLFEFSPEKLDPAACLRREDSSDCEDRRAVSARKFQSALERVHFGMNRVESELQKFGGLKENVHSGRTARLISHRPDRLVSFETSVMTDELNFLMLQTSHELRVITPYLVLSDDQIEVFRSLIRQGKKVIVITNSLRSGDDLFALTAYKRDRAFLRDLGVEVYEFNIAERTLHAKVVLIDESQSLIGTYNFDPRSAYLNREFGIYFHEQPGDSPVTQELRKVFDELLTHSHRVIFDGQIELDPHEGEYLSSKKKKLMKAVDFIMPLIRDLI